MNSKRAVSLSLVLVFLCSFLLFGCAPKEKRFEATITGYFDTVTTIVAYMEDKAAFDEEVQNIANELKAYDAMSDAYSSASVNNIKTINDKAGSGEPVKVNLFIIDMLLTAKEAYKITNGAVNVALGSVTSIWRAYISNGINDASFSKVPSAQKLSEAALHTDIEKVIIDTENSTVYLEDSEMRLDVGAFAKGYAASLLIYSAKERGVDSMLINIGGAVSAIGTRADASAWSVATQDPRNDSETIVNLKLTDLSVSTSGDYQRYYEVNGERYHHVIDPQTLMPSKNAVAVTVIATNPILADYMSTALMIMSLKDATALAESIEGIEAMWVTDSGDIFTTSGFNAYITK